MTYGESETLKENVLVSENSISQDLFKEDLITFWFLTNNKNRLIKRMSWQPDHSPLLFYLDLRKDEHRGK